MQHSATHCNTCIIDRKRSAVVMQLRIIVGIEKCTDCNRLQHTATHASHCNTLQLVICVLQCVAVRCMCCSMLQCVHFVTPTIIHNCRTTACNTPQHTATHCNALQHTACGMGWLRLVGCLKLYISFAEHRHFYRALLQKRPIILRSLLVVATPYSYSCAS